jgi:hypothetical protein
MSTSRPTYPSIVELLFAQHIADVEERLVRQGFQLDEQVTASVPLTFIRHSPLTLPALQSAPLAVASTGHAQNSVRWNR